MAIHQNQLLIARLAKVPTTNTTDAGKIADGYEWTEDNDDFIAWFCYDAIILERDHDNSTWNVWNIAPWDFDAGDAVTYSDVKVVWAFKTTGTVYEQIVYCGHGLDDFETHDQSLGLLHDLLEDSETFVFSSGYTGTSPEPLDEWEADGALYERIAPGCTLADAFTANAGTTTDPNYFAYADDAVFRTDRDNAIDELDGRDTTGHHLFAVSTRFSNIFEDNAGTTSALDLLSVDDILILLDQLGEETEDPGDDDSDTDASIQAFLGSIGSSDTGGGTIERQDHSKMEAG